MGPWESPSPFRGGVGKRPIVIMNTPLVSVIVPNYNHARFLDERMESILGQTCQNFEV